MNVVTRLIPIFMIQEDSFEKNNSFLLIMNKNFKHIVKSALPSAPPPPIPTILKNDATRMLHTCT